MNKFLRNIFFFALGLIVIFSINWTINYLIIKNSDIKLNSSEILIIGDSHPMRAINPFLLKNAQNICQSAEPYVITYWKLKKINKEIKLDTVLIGFAPHNISDFNDLKFLEKKWSNEMFERSYLIEDFKSLEDIKIDYKGYYSFLFKRFCLFPTTNHFHYTGGYINSYKSDLSNFQKTIDRHFYFKGKSSNISEISISYLDSIIDLCTSNNAVPILINTPVHKYYKDSIPKHIQVAFNLMKKQLKENNISMIEGNSQDYTDSLFLNSDHLNGYGATVFTKELKKKLKDNN
jgi:hypothetical protein